MLFSWPVSNEEWRHVGWNNGGISGNGDWESTFCRCVQATRQRKVWNEVCTWERSPLAASGCPFPSRSNKAFRHPPSSSQRASVAEIAGLLPAFSDVFAVFLSKGSAVWTCRFFVFFFLAQLADWTISWVHRERGWGWEGGQPSSTLPPTRFHLKKCNANSVPKRHCSLRSVEGLNFAPMEWINPFDELRVRSLPLKSVFYLLVGRASAAWCCLMALLSMVKQVISYLFMLEPFPGATKKILHISLLDSLQLYWIWQYVQRWLNPPARFWWLHLCWFQPHSCCHLHQCGSLFYSFMHQIDCCLVFWLGATCFIYFFFFFSFYFFI